jgi:amidase
MDLAGEPTSQGNATIARQPATRTDAVVRRWIDAGLVVFGKTNVPEFGLKAITEPRAFGPARNPWNLQHTPGGSSGGAAAAVAAGIVPVAAAADGGGSIRIPAAYCGLFGLKPSRGRVSCAPQFDELWEGAVAAHAITRSVRDSAALLDVLAGPEPGDPYVAAPPHGPTPRRSVPIPAGCGSRCARVHRSAGRSMRTGPAQPTTAPAPSNRSAMRSSRSSRRSTGCSSRATT